MNTDAILKMNWCEFYSEESFQENKKHLGWYQDQMNQLQEDYNKGLLKTPSEYRARISQINDELQKRKKALV